MGLLCCWVVAPPVMTGGRFQVQGDLFVLAFAVMQAGAFTKCGLESPDGEVNCKPRDPGVLGFRQQGGGSIREGG